MRDAELLREDIGILRETIRANNGENVASGAFVRKVDQLISDFYDDIGELTALQLGDILDLFLIKVLYVNRRSRDAETLTYLGRLMERYLLGAELTLAPSGSHLPYLSDLLQELSNPSGQYGSPFEACRKYGDNALFITGVYPQSLGRKRAAGRMGGAATADVGHFVTLGRRYYEMAAQSDTGQSAHLRATLERLSKFFDVYVEALNEMSHRYVMGIDMQLIADKMLDAFNRYKETHAQDDLDTARKYASLLRLEGKQWPELERAGESGPAYF
jgi:hypothetical protein